MVQAATPIIGTPENVNADGRVVTTGGEGSFAFAFGPDGRTVALSDFQALSPLERWQNEWFGAAELADPSISGDDADPNGNGLPNWAEFAFDSNPRGPSPDRLPAAIAADEAGFAAGFSYLRRVGSTGSAVFATAAGIQDPGDGIGGFADLAGSTGT